MKVRLHPYARQPVTINPMGDDAMTSAQVNTILWRCLNRSLIGTPEDIITVFIFCRDNGLNIDEVLPEIAAYRFDPPETIQ